MKKLRKCQIYKHDIYKGENCWEDALFHTWHKTKKNIFAVIEDKNGIVGLWGLEEFRFKAGE